MYRDSIRKAQGPFNAGFRTLPTEVALGACTYSDVAGPGTLYGGVYTSLIDNAMGHSVSSLVGFRTATTQMNVRFLEAVGEKRITRRSEVVHSTRQKATAEGRIFDGEGNLVAMGTGSFRIFEKQGNPIV